MQSQVALHSVNDEPSRIWSLIVAMETGDLHAGQSADLWRDAVELPGVQSVADVIIVPEPHHFNLRAHAVHRWRVVSGDINLFDGSSTRGGYRPIHWFVGA